MLFRKYPSGHADTQTDTHTDVLSTVLRNRSRGRSKYCQLLIRRLTTPKLPLPVGDLDLHLIVPWPTNGISIGLAVLQSTFV